MLRKLIIPTILFILLTGCGMPLEPFIEILIQDLPLPTVEITQTPVNTPTETPTLTDKPTETPTNTPVPTETPTLTNTLENTKEEPIKKSKCCLCIIKSLL